MALIHTFSEFTQPTFLDPSVLGSSSCITGDPQRMYALYSEMEDAIRRAQDKGDRTIGQVLEVPFLELEAEAAAVTDNRAQDYYEQMLGLDAQQLEAAA